MARGSRFLNDNGSALGLNTADLIGAVGVLIITSELLKPIHLDFLSVPASILALSALIPIRLRHRRRIIRDALSYFLGVRALRNKATRKVTLC